MDSKRKRENKLKNRNYVLASERDLGKTQPEKIGRLRKLLDWISTGVAKSDIRSTGCPT
jgi:hypothetical protein